MDTSISIGGTHQRGRKKVETHVNPQSSAVAYPIMSPVCGVWPENHHEAEVLLILRLVQANCM